MSMPILLLLLVNGRGWVQTLGVVCSLQNVPSRLYEAAVEYRSVSILERDLYHTKVD